MPNNGVFTYETVVEPEDIDQLGHVNNTVYVSWLQEAAIAHSTSLGWPIEAYVKLGSCWVVSSHYIKYLRPAYLGQTVQVKTWIAHLDGRHSWRRYSISCNGKLLAEAETTWAFVNFATKHPCRIPDEVAASFVVVPEEHSLINPSGF